jgi:hypothetical protein
MFRKIMTPIVNFALKPYFERSKILNKQMDLIEEIYNKGDKEKALNMCEEILKTDGSYKPARVWRVRIHNEVKENNESIKTNLKK